MDPEVLVVDQDEVPGTGRAVQCALGVLDAAALGAAAAREERSGSEQVLSGPVVVTAGDVPLLDTGTLSELLRAHAEEGNAVTILTTHLSDPAGYGRIVRDGGAVVGVVEERDA
ncbi:NTP transferase domain-containing protein, partial [Georgenia sp. 10Sc9-8]|nr:NTP transferase domain-containing protein [Georgenia halotolerans]